MKFSNIKEALVSKLSKRLIAAVIAAGLIWAGFGEEIAKEISGEATEIIIDQVVE